MSAPSDNETWIIEAGDDVIQKKARDGVSSLSPLERLIYCLWVADYGMTNAGALETAHDLHADFQTEGARLAKELGLQKTHVTFALPTPELQRQYFDRRDKICHEIRYA
jgi:hypothetical protein